jgi:hypothetical protein
LKGELDKLNSVSPQLAYWMIFLAFGKESEESMQILYKKQPLIKEAFEQPVIRQAQEQFHLFISDPVNRDMERRHREYIFLQQSDVKKSYKEGRIKDAIRMKARGFSLNDIISITELSKEEIESLG